MRRLILLLCFVAVATAQADGRYFPASLLFIPRCLTIGDSSRENPVDSVLQFQSISSRYFSHAAAQSGELEKNLSRTTLKALHQLQRRERRLRAQLLKVDSLKAQSLFANSVDSLGYLKQRIKGKVQGALSQIPGGGYIQKLDSLQCSLQFLAKYRSQLTEVKSVDQKLERSISSIQNLEGKLSQVNDIQQYIEERKTMLTDALSQMGGRFSSDLAKLNQSVANYRSTIAEYKTIFQRPDDIESKTWELLNKVPAFQQFAERHSQLAGLFGLPSGYGTPAALSGLQTRLMLTQELQGRLQSASEADRGRIESQIQQGFQQLDQLKAKIPGIKNDPSAQLPSGPSSSTEMKAGLFQRMEYGVNVQFEKGTELYPACSDLAGQVGYRFSKNGSFGLGTAFKLGWGRIQKVHFTAQGISIRSFLEYRLKGTLYVNGDLEYNYNTVIPNLPALSDWNGWSRSALLGVERKYRISDKISGAILILYDFLARSRIPSSSPWVIRTGYAF